MSHINNINPRSIALCQTCVYFAALVDKGETIKGGYCKRFPPVPVVVYGQDVMGQPKAQVMAHFPPVNAGEFCGEHEDGLDDGDEN